MTRRLATLAALALVAAAGCGGDDDEEKAATQSAPRETATEQAPTATAEAPAPKPKRRPAVDQRQAKVQVALNELVEAYELSDQPRICSLLGQSGSDAEGCAARAEVDLMRLPSSEELSVDRTDFNGKLARLTLSSGAIVTLRREGSKWVVIGLAVP